MVQDNDLIEKIKNENCDESLKELIRRHTAICLNIIQKYGGYFSNDRERIQDLIDDKDYLIYRAAMSFDKDKGAKFITWLGNHARYECLNALNNRNRAFVTTTDTELSFHIHQQAESEKGVDENEVKFVFSVLGRLKDKRIKDIFSLRYFSDAKNPSWSRIAKQLRISTQTAINLHEKGRKVLKQKLKSKECFDEL